MPLRLIIALLLSTSLVLPSPVAFAVGVDTISDFEEGKMGVNRSLARPISKYALKKMGTPGFLISKYMTYRKLMTNPVCTTSEKLSFIGNLLTLAGDITNHVMTIKNTRTLKKEFTGKTDKIEQYLRTKKDLLETPKETGEQLDVQLMAIDYSIRSNELELSRLKMLRNFKNPALALFLVSSIMNAQEALAEGTSFGTYLAAVNACKTAAKPVQASQEGVIEASSAAGVAAAGNSQTDAPWYVKPFLWIGGKLDELGNSETITTMNAGRKGMNIENSAKQDEYGGLGPLTSANYAEEMIVGVVDSLSKEKKNSGLGGSLKSEAINIGTRLLVRKAVKANIVAVDGFMRSSIGRTVVYGYNLWVIYTEFENLKGDIADTNTKISALKEIRKNMTSSSGSVTFDQKEFQKESEALFKSVFAALMSDAFADTLDLPSVPLKMCLESADCKKVGDFITPEMNKSLSALPLEIRNKQINLLNSSFSFSEVRKFNKGLISIQQIDQERVDREIKTYETEVEALADLLHKKKIVSKDRYLAFEEQTVNKDFDWYAPAMVSDFNTLGVVASAKVSPLMIEKPLVHDVSSEDLKEQVLEEKKEDSAKSSAKELEAMALEKKLQENMSTEFEYEDVHQNKSETLWNIISKRYQKRAWENESTTSP